MAKPKSEPQPDFRKAAVLANASLLNAVLLFFATLIGTVLLLKAIGKSDFKFGSVELSLNYAWVAFAIVTLGHKVVSEYFFASLFSYRRGNFPSEWRTLVEELTVAGPIAFRGLMRRRPMREGSLVYVMHAKDPTTWVYYAFAIGLFSASLPFSGRTFHWDISTILLSAYICIWNWLIGSKWSVALGELPLPEEQTFFYRHTSMSRSRSIVSGGLDGFGPLMSTAALHLVNLFFYFIGVVLLIAHLWA